MIVESDELLWQVSEQITGDRIGPDHEAIIRNLVLDLLPIGGTFIDVGAHVGCYSVRAARKASKVHAIEPNPDAVEILKANCNLNHIDNVTIYPVAAWNCDTELALESPNGFPRDASTRTIPSSNEQADTVPARPLDKVLANLDAADLLKLDVEGSDLYALEGMRNLLIRLRPALIIEDHSVLGYFGPQELQDKIASLNYSAELFACYVADYWLCKPKG